ncbi:hypothetical protein RvY_16283 [Ramazzottius varieornatus]|uniref:HTH CENPB-type domain-containing protein n=1 Tax=Ramazzottius varieornatus TaxID=947166 RepID=A0A1D1VXW5_RAMVA|nr:hypothetical protein RvY_16283 [Ramazzottius varieornatus]
MKRKRQECFPDMEKEVYLYVLLQRDEQLEVLNCDIQEKALEVVNRDHGEDPGFAACNRWVLDFRKRFCLVYQRITKIGRKMSFTADDIINHENFFLLIEEHIYAHQTPKNRILNMDQTMIRLVSPGKKTVSSKGVNGVSVKHPPGEKEGFTINLTIGADGRNLPAKIVFKTAAKSGKLSDNFVAKLEAPTNVIIKSAWSVWWNEDHDRKYIEKMFPMNQEFTVLVRDSHSVHKCPQIWGMLDDRNTKQIIIPGGMTGKWQPLDVSVNKCFKDYFRASYRSWRKNNIGFTKSRNLRKPEKKIS